MGKRLTPVGLALALSAALLVGGCVSSDPNKVYDYSKAGFTPDHSR